MIPRRPGRPIGVGVQLPEVEREVRWPELRAIARRAEDVGFDSIWFGDHLLYRYASGETRGPWEAWTTLAGLAEATERITLGPLVAATAFHAPFMLAKQAATVDEISGGRLVLGIGAGWNQTEFAALGAPFDHRDRPLRGGVHDRPDAAPRRLHRLRGRVLTSPATPSCCRGRRAPAARRSSSARSRPRMLAADAALRATPGTPGTRTPATRPEGVAAAARRSSTRPRAPPAATRPTIERTVAVLVQLPGGTGPRDGRHRPEAGRAAARAATPRRSPTRCAPTRGEGIGHVQLVLDPITEASVAALAPGPRAAGPRLTGRPATENDAAATRRGC